ncbi:MAG TPA: SHOCT domain-containing protein [Gammaproteobacteria bacterium]|nr:SHOCT domain-containing protein [Gammaproteobacteria bacterium]
MMDNGGNLTSGMGWGMGFGGLIMVLFWGLIIFAIVAIVRWLSGGGGDNDAGRSKQKTPLDILQERYARGEIDEQEFQEKRRNLEQ